MVVQPWAQGKGSVHNDSLGKPCPESELSALLSERKKQWIFFWMQNLFPPSVCPWLHLQFQVSHTDAIQIEFIQDSFVQMSWSA